MLTSLILLASTLSPFISTVYEYAPAPGQFVNVAPEYEEGDDYEAMLSKASEQLCGDRTPGLVSLGAFGGYIIFGFDHPVVNVAGEDDFRVYGNAIPTSSEPGIVSVSIDANGNGLPDDEWYELVGSEHNNPLTAPGVSIVYHRPAPGHTPVLDPGHDFVTDAEYSLWETSVGTSGYVVTNNRHTQPYWPLWLPEDRTALCFTGTLLPPNAIDRNGKGTLYDFTMFDWGYVDNRPNTDTSGFNIDNAVDAAGNRVFLSHADFIRVHTATNQQCGWLGESSTEVSGAEDLHPEEELSGVAVPSGDGRVWCVEVGGVIKCAHPVNLSVFSIDGRLITRLRLNEGHHSLSLPSGCYLISGEARCSRIFLKNR